MRRGACRVWLVEDSAERQIRKPERLAVNARLYRCWTTAALALVGLFACRQSLVDRNAPAQRQAKRPAGGKRQTLHCWTTAALALVGLFACRQPLRL